MSYWSSNGKYQQKADILNEMVPDMGESFDTRIETFRLASNVYYDIHNNGGDNIIDEGSRSDEYEKLNRFLNRDIKRYIEFKEEQLKEDDPEDDDRLFKKACAGCDQMLDAVIEWIESTGFLIVKPNEQAKTIQ